MSDVVRIKQGRFFDLPKKTAEWAERTGSMYGFSTIKLHMGTPEGIDKRTGKGVSASTIIKKGEAPPNAAGKEALICYKDGKPLKVKIIYFAK